MCKLTVLSFVYVVVFVAVVNCDVDTNEGVLYGIKVYNETFLVNSPVTVVEGSGCRVVLDEQAVVMKTMSGDLRSAVGKYRMMMAFDSDDNTDASVGRTFGHNALKRLSFIFLPVMFTLGVISTLLMALAVISVKNLAIGVVLLIVTVSQAVSRLFLTSAGPSPLVYHPRAELLPAPVAPWPAPGPLLSPWGRSDNDATISD